MLFSRRIKMITLAIFIMIAGALSTTAHAYATTLTNLYEDLPAADMYLDPPWPYTYTDAQVGAGVPFAIQNKHNYWDQQGDYTQKMVVFTGSTGTYTSSSGYIFKVKYTDIGYTKTGKSVDAQVTCTKAYIGQLGDDGSGSNWEYAVFNFDTANLYALQYYTCVRLDMTVELYEHGTSNKVNGPSYIFFHDLDVSGIDDYGDYDYAFAEAVELISGYDAYYTQSGGTLAVTTRNGHPYIRAHGTYVDDEFDPRDALVVRSNTGTFSFQWQGDGCGTGLFAKYQGKSYSPADPVKTNPDNKTQLQIKNLGQTAEFNVTQFVDYFTDSNKPQSLAISDTLNNIFDAANATVTVYRNGTRTSNYAVTKSGQTITATAQNITNEAAAGEIRVNIKVPLKTGYRIPNPDTTTNPGYATILNHGTFTYKNASGKTTSKNSNDVQVLVPVYKVHYMWRARGAGDFVEKYTDEPIYTGAYTVRTFANANINPTTGYTARGYARSDTGDVPVTWENITSPGSGTEITGETWFWATESQNPVTVHYMWKGIHDNSFHEVEAARVVRVPPGTYKTKTFLQATIEATEGCTAVGYAQTTSGTATPTTFNAITPGANATINAETWFWATENWNPIPVHYMWKGANDSRYNEIESVTLTAPNTSYKTLTLSQAHATPTAGYLPVGWQKTLSGTSNPSLDSYASGTINPGSNTEITPHETWFWATEKYNCFTVHYMWRPDGAVDFTEKGTFEDVPAGNYTILPLADAGITPSAGCTPVSYGFSDDGNAPSSLNTNAAGSTVVIQDGDIWLWASETRNTYPVHYMWKPNGAASYTQVAQENNVPYGSYMTLPFADANITPTSGFNAVGYGKTNTESAPSDLNAVNPGGAIQVSGETWLWATESQLTFPVHYMWRSHNATTFTEVGEATQEVPGDYAILEPSAAGITPTAGYSVVAYGMTSENAAPSDDQLSAHPSGKTIDLTGETWFWATESQNTYTVHYMFKTHSARNYAEKKKVENVPYGTYATLALASANINPSDGCTITAYGQSTSSTAPSNLSSVTPTSNIQVTGETWLWAAETLNTYPVHYMWRGDGETTYHEVKTEPEVPHGIYTTEAISNLGVTPVEGGTISAYGKTASETAPADNQLNAVIPTNSTDITQETWLWASEKLTRFPVHYMWKGGNDADYSDVKTVNVPAGNYQTETLNGIGVTVSAGHSAKAYGETVSNSAPADLAALTPGDLIEISQETWLWATEAPLSYPVHYMWKSHSANNYSEVLTDPNVPYGTYTTKSFAQANITPSQGHTSKGYGKTTTATAPGNLNQVIPASATDITGETWLWASEDVNTYPVHYMWKPSGASNYTETRTISAAPYGTYQVLALNDANITPTDGCTPVAYGKTTSATAPASNEGTAPGSSFNLTGETWLWASESANTYTVHYMWKPEGANSYKETFTAQNVPYGSYTTEQLSDARITPTAGCTTFAYGQTATATAPSNTSGTAPGLVIRVTGDVWLWATETRNAYPVHYMYSTGSWTDWKEVKYIESVPHGSYKTLSISQLGVSPKYPNLVAGYGKTVSSAVPDGLAAVNIGASTPITQETWLWAMESPLIHGSQVTTYKSSDPAPNTVVSAGQEITYKLTHTNTGATTSAYTLVRDYIPEGTTYVDGSVSEGGVYVAASESANGKAYVEWVKSAIAPRDSVESSFKVKVDNNPPEIIRNHALTSSQKDPLTPGDPVNKEPGDESNEVQHPTENGVKPLPQIEIVKSSVPSPGIQVSAGNAIDYTLTVKNTGGSDALDVAVYDEVPQYTTLAGFSTEYGGQSVNGGAAVGWNIPTLAVGKSVELHMSVTCVQDDGVIIANQATYCRNTPGIPTSPLPNSSNIVEHPTKPVNIITGSQVTTYKDSDPAPNSRVEAGQEITYKLTHTNTGAATSAYTLVRDYIPEGVEYVEGSISEGGIFVSAENSASGRAYVEWVKFGIPVGASVESSFKVTVADNPPSIIRNHALTGSQDDPIEPGNPANPDPALMSNEVRHTTDGTPCGPQIRIVKSSDPVPGTVVTQGSIIVYKLEVTNIGDDIAHNIGVYDDIPAMTQLVDFEEVQNCTSLYGGKALGWNIAELGPGGSTVLTFRVIVAEQGATGQYVTNRASYAMDVDGIPQGHLENTSNIVEHPFAPADNIQAMIMSTNDAFPLLWMLVVTGAATIAAVGMKTRRSSRK